MGPNTNRMASPDSIVPDPTNPQSFNRYSYVFNQPTYYNDPSGHCPWCLVTGAIGGLITGGTYLLTTPTSEWNGGDLLLTTGAGVAGGALIGTGVGAAAGTTVIAAAVGTGIAVSAESYLINNAVTGESFDRIDFSITTIAGGVEGGIATLPGVGPISSSFVSAAAGAGSSILSDVFHGEQVDGSEALSSAGTGFAAGIIGSGVSGQFGKDYIESGRRVSLGLRGEANPLDFTQLHQNPAFIPSETLSSIARTGIRDFSYSFGIGYTIDQVSNLVSNPQPQTPPP